MSVATEISLPVFMKEWRLNRGLSQAKAAKLTGLKNALTWSRWETGQQGCSLEEVFKLLMLTLDRIDSLRLRDINSLDKMGENRLQPSLDALCSVSGDTAGQNRESNTSAVLSYSNAAAAEPQTAIQGDIEPMLAADAPQDKSDPDSDIATAVRDLKPGDQIDLESDPYADPAGNLPDFKVAYATVCQVDPETPTCFVVYIEGGEGFGMPPDHTVPLLKPIDSADYE